MHESLSKRTIKEDEDEYKNSLAVLIDGKRGCCPISAILSSYIATAPQPNQLVKGALSVERWELLMHL